MFCVLCLCLCLLLFVYLCLYLYSPIFICLILLLFLLLKYGFLLLFSFAIIYTHFFFLCLEFVLILLYIDFSSCSYLAKTTCSILVIHTKKHKIMPTSIIVAGGYRLVIFFTFFVDLFKWEVFW